MGEVVELNNYKDMTPSFTIEARMDDTGGWAIVVTDFYDSRMDTHQVYREIADALIPIAGGMLHNAEDLEPTERGCIVSNITLYNSGIIEVTSLPVNTEERKAWLLSALDKIKRRVKRGTLDK